MAWLLLNIVFGSAFLLCLKWVQQDQRGNVIHIGTVNYVWAAMMVAPQFWMVYQGSDGIAGTQNLSPAALALGATMGLSYFTAFFLVINMVRWVGAAASTVVSVLSIVAPILLAAWLWSETPNAQQWVGIVLALAALMMIGGHQPPKNEQRPWFTGWVLLAFFFLAGANRVTQDTFRRFCDGEQRPVFLMAAFSVTAAPSLAILWSRRSRLKWFEVVCGVGLGTANLLQTFFILKALETQPAFLVFPVASAGSLILTTAVATRLMRERLKQRTYFGIALTAIALVLLHWE